MSHRARKRFGQHFLTSTETIRSIVAAIAPQQGQTIVEIGPGKAAITAPLADSGATLHAVEFDRDLVAKLKRQFADRDNVTVHEADALRFDFASLGDKLRIVGNLPYNISTPLLFHLLTYRKNVEDLHFMLQKEVVERIAASPGSKDFGRLTVMLGCRLEVVPLFDVPPGAFTPPPRVISSVVRMRPLAEGHFDIRDEAAFGNIVRQAFSRRRKTLRNALDGHVTVAELEAAGISPAKRPEEIPVKDWINLANQKAGDK